MTAATENEPRTANEGKQMLYRIAPPSLLVFRDEDEPIVESRVVPYEEWSEVDSIVEGHFMERWAHGSLTKTFAESVNRARVYFEHGRSRLFDSQPIADLRERWEQPDGGYFRAALLDGLPDLFLNGLRRGLYGASIGAEVIKMERVRAPKPSDYNPQGLEERTYKEVRAFDFSITPRPHYASATVALRSINDDLLMEQLLEDPKRLLEAITRAAEPAEPIDEKPNDEAEPQHSGREEPAEPDPERSRSTQPSRDYLQTKEAPPSWRL